MAMIPTETATARSCAWLGALACLVLLLVTAFGELTYVGDGTGWDGRLYADFAIKASTGLVAAVREMPRYHAQRILPSVVVAKALRVLHVRLHPEGFNAGDDWYIVTAFRWYNFVLLSVGVYFWMCICRALQFSIRRCYLSTILMFATFPVLKQFIYFPVQTDTTAFFLSIALLHYFLKRSAIGILAVSVLSAFCWPLLFYGGIMLFVCGPQPLVAETRPLVRYSSAFVAALCPMAFSLYSFYKLGYRPLSGAYGWAIPLSAALTAVLLFGAFAPLIPNALGALKRALGVVKTYRPYLAVVLIYALNILFRKVSTEGGVSFDAEIHRMSVEHLAKPGIAVISDLTYFGPVVLFAMWNWQGIARLATSFGLGVTILFFEGATQLLLDSEARRSLLFLPWLVCFAAKMYRREITSGLLISVLGVSALLSEVWMLFNRLPGEKNVEPLAFPIQAFIGRFGPWMNDQSYVLYGVATLLGFLTFAIYHTVAARRANAQ